MSATLTTSTAHILAFLFSSSYVGSLYVSKHARLSFSSRPTHVDAPRAKQDNERWRDDPDVIQARLIAASAATLICCASVFGIVVYFHPDPTLHTTLTLLGVPTLASLTRNPVVSLKSTVSPHLITPLLFLGPLYACYLERSLPFQKYWSFQKDVIETLGSWQGIRNYIVAPITEELVFRSCVLSVYQLSGAPPMKMIFLAPLVFGLAHIHHAYETYNRYGRTRVAAKRAVLTTLFQLLYTSLFGAHTSFLFLRTQSVFPPISAHVFCNFMGLPNGPGGSKSVAVAYIAGIIGFASLLGPWTRP